MNKRVEFDHKNSKGKHREVLTLALLVAVLPPTWAVVSPYLGVHVGPIALITTGIYGANGNKLEDAAKISVGYIAGDIWSLIATVVMQKTPYNATLTLWTTLFILGFVAVVVSSNIPQYTYLPSWLAGWAIGMRTMNLDATTSLLRLFLEIAAAMLVGVYYVGALIDKIHSLIK